VSLAGGPTSDWAAGYKCPPSLYPANNDYVATVGSTSVNGMGSLQDAIGVIVPLITASAFDQRNQIY
jgi:hypothetical protein